MCCLLLPVAVYCVLRVGCGVVCCSLGVACGLLCVVRCFPLYLHVCWWHLVGDRCLLCVCVFFCLMYAVCGVLCIDCCWMLFMVVLYVLFVGVGGSLSDSLVVVCWLWFVVRRLLCSVCVLVFGVACCLLCVDCCCLLVSFAVYGSLCVVACALCFCGLCVLSLVR